MKRKVNGKIRKGGERWRGSEGRGKKLRERIERRRQVMRMGGR